MQWITALAAAVAGVPAGLAASVLISRIASTDADSAARSRTRHFAPTLLAVAGFAAMGVRFGPSPALPAYCYLVALSVVLAFVDAKHRRLPDVLTITSYPAGIALLGAAAAFLPNGLGFLLHAMLGGAAAVAFYLFLAAISPSGLGWGDVKLSGVAGLYLGWLGARAFVAGLAGGFVLAAVAGIVLIAAGKATRKSQIPFGPFMLAGALTAILASPYA